MKTKELIRQLMEQDPSGEEEVCVNNVDIHFVQREPACWDGHHQVLIRDESKTNCYNIIGAEYRSEGTKINITPLSIQWAIYNDPEIPVSYVGDYTEEDHKKQVEEWRAETRRIIKEIADEKSKRKKGK